MKSLTLFQLCLLIVLIITAGQLMSIASSLRTLAAPPIEMQFKLDEGVGEPEVEPSKLLTHNAAGGWIESCGDLPGMVGDDC